MHLEDVLHNLILYDKKQIIIRIKQLRIKLEIDKKLDNEIDLIEDIDFVFLSNIDLEKSSTEIKQQMILNANKRLELRCVIKGKKKYLKGYGLIKNISKQQMKDIFEFLTLIKLSKRISDVSYYASQYYRADNLLNEIFTN